MKKLTILMIALFVAGSLAPEAHAQEGTFSPKMVIKTNPLSALGGPFWVIVVPITGEYKALFEIKTAEKQSFTFGASYLGPSLLLNLDNITNDGSNISGINTAGYKVQAMYKFFITRSTSAPEGFYVGPHVSYASAAITSKDNPNDKIGGIKLNINGVIGYQLISDSGFALDIYTGLGFKNRQWIFDGNSEDTFDFGGIGSAASAGVAFGLNFGIAF